MNIWYVIFVQEMVYPYTVYRVLESISATTDEIPELNNVHIKYINKNINAQVMILARNPDLTQVLELPLAGD
jgi:hypothetical protein